VNIVSIKKKAADLTALRQRKWVSVAEVKILLAYSHRYYADEKNKEVSGRK
jgi:hypothetical protein